MSLPITNQHYKRGVCRSMLNKFYDNICKHYHLYSFIANALNALSMAGLAFLGILTDTMTVAWLIGWGLMFVGMFFLGQLLNQEIDDLDKVKGHSCETNTCRVKE